MSKPHPTVVSPKTAVSSFAANLQNVSDMVATGPRRLRHSNSPEAIAALRKEVSAQAYEEGFKEGKKAGLEAGKIEGRELGRADSFQQLAADRQAELAAFGAELQKVAEAFREGLGDYYSLCEERLSELAIQAMRALLTEELKLGRESVVKIVKDSLKEITHARHVRIRVNPFDLELLEKHRAEVIAASTELRDVVFVDDPSILGGCVVETDGGVIDASLDSRLDSIAETFREAA